MGPLIFVRELGELLVCLLLSQVAAHATNYITDGIGIYKYVAICSILNSFLVDACLFLTQVYAYNETHYHFNSI